MKHTSQENFHSGAFTVDPFSPKTIEMPATTKLLPCSGCGAECIAGKNAVMIFCRDCSAKMGVKK